jgi:hypothetical protein
MTSRKALVELLEQHLGYTPGQRAEVVHCRCGSRLPWKACHSTGIGQPPHYHMHLKWGLCYRVAPLAKCPCKNTTKAHYECCWMEGHVDPQLPGRRRRGQAVGQRRFAALGGRRGDARGP